MMKIKDELEFGPGGFWDSIGSRPRWMTANAAIPDVSEDEWKEGAVAAREVAKNLSYALERIAAIVPDAREAVPDVYTVTSPAGVTLAIWGVDSPESHAYAGLLQVLCEERTIVFAVFPSHQELIAKPWAEASRAYKFFQAVYQESSALIKEPFFRELSPNAFAAATFCMYLRLGALFENEIKFSAEHGRPPKRQGGSHGRH